MSKRDRPHSALASLQAWPPMSGSPSWTSPPSAWPPYPSVPPRPFSASYSPALGGLQLPSLFPSASHRPASAGLTSYPRSASAGRIQLNKNDAPLYPQGAWLASRPESAEPEGSLGVPLPRPVTVQSMIRKPKEVFAEELAQAKSALQRASEENRVMATEKRRLEGQLMVCRGNIDKAEELLNNKEKTHPCANVCSPTCMSDTKNSSLSPQQGLSQMFRNPETTALVGRLRENVRTLIMERDSLQAQLKDCKMDMRSTRTAELLAERNAFSEEVKRQATINDALVQGLTFAEQSAAASAAQAAQATKTLKEYLRQGKGLPSPPPKLPPGNSLSKGSTAKTLQVLRACHTGLLSQAQAVRAVFPRHVVTWDDLDRCASSQHAIMGGGDVLRYLRTHIKRLAQELYGLPGATLGLDDDKAVKAEQAPASYRQLLFGLAEHMRMLRGMSSDMFYEDTVFEVDMEELAAVCMLLADEVDRLSTRGADPGNRSLRSLAVRLDSGNGSSFSKRKRLPPYDSDAQHNPLFSTDPPASNEKTLRTKGEADEDHEEVDRGAHETKANGPVGSSREADSPAPGVMRQRSQALETATNMDVHRGVQETKANGDVGSPRSPTADKGTSPCKDEGTQCEEDFKVLPGVGMDGEQLLARSEGSSQQQQEHQHQGSQTLQQPSEQQQQHSSNEAAAPAAATTPQPEQQQQQQQQQHSSNEAAAPAAATTPQPAPPALEPEMLQQALTGVLEFFRRIGDLQPRGQQQLQQDMIRAGCFPAQA